MSTPLQAIVTQDYAAYDALPVSAKLLLLIHLADNIGGDLAMMRDQFFHDVLPAVATQTLHPVDASRPLGGTDVARL